MVGSQLIAWQSVIAQFTRWRRSEAYAADAKARERE